MRKSADETGDVEMLRHIGHETGIPSPELDKWADYLCHAELHGHDRPEVIREMHRAVFPEEQADVADRCGMERVDKYLPACDAGVDMLADDLRWFLPADATVFRTPFTACELTVVDAPAVTVIRVTADDGILTAFRWADGDTVLKPASGHAVAACVSPMRLARFCETGGPFDAMFA